MSSKDYGPFEDLAGDAGGGKQDDGFGPFADLAAAQKAEPSAPKKPYTRPPSKAKTLSLGGVVDEVSSLGKKAANAIGSLYANGGGEQVDAGSSDALGADLGSAIMQQAGPATLSLSQQMERGVGKDLPMSAADARGNANWDSLSPQGQAKARERQAQLDSRINAPDLKAAPERTGLQNALSKTNRKPLDNSLGGLALETVGDAARGAVRGVQGVAGSAWGGIRAAADLTAGPDSVVSEVAAGATKAADQAQTGIQSPDRDSLTQQVFESTFSSVPVLLAFGTGAKTLAVLGAQSGAQAYSEARNMGKTPDEAAERGVWHGLAEVMGERLSLPVLGDLFAKAASRASNQELGQVLSELLIKDQVGEQATTLLQSAYDKAGRGGTRPDMTLADYLDDMANTAKVSLGQSLLMGGGAGIAKGLAKMGDKPMPQLNPFEIAKSKGFLTTPPTTEDTPTVQRDRFAGMFRDLGAHFGLPKRAVDRAIEEADGIPTPALGGFFKRIAQAYERRGIFGAPVDPDVLGVFDGPMQAAQPQADAAGQQADDLEMGDATGLADDTGAQEAVQDSAQSEQDQTPRPIDLAAEDAATSPTNDKAEPTDAQKDAGNYAKGHGKFAGMDIAIENPKGSTRSGVDAQGTPWQTTMQHHYGYLKGTMGADKDHVDVFVGPGRDETRAFVIDQIDPKTGKFDEHKVIFGADTPEQAREIYQANYDKGWKGLGAITELPMQAFKSWVKDGAKRQPLGDISQAVAEADARNAVGEIGQILAGTAKQAAATPAPTKTAKASAASARGKQHMQLDAENDTMLQALAKLGGISRDVVQREFGLKPEEVKHTVKMGSLKGYPFRKTGGMDMDQAITALQEAGYFDGVADDDLRSVLEESIYDEMGGAGRLTSVGAMRKAEAQYNERQAEIEQEQAQLAAEDQAEADAEREAIIAESGMSADEIDALRDDDLPDLASIDVLSSPDTLMGFMRSMGFSEEEVANEIAKRYPSQASVVEAGVDAGRQAPATDGAGGSAQGSASRAPGERGAAQADAGADQGRQEGADQQDLTLSAQTEQDLRAKAEREDTAKKADAAKKAAEQERLRKQDEARDAKARADATVDDFQLGQSADQQLSGMGDLFSQPPAEDPPAIQTLRDIPAGKSEEWLMGWNAKARGYSMQWPTGRPGRTRVAVQQFEQGWMDAAKSQAPGRELVNTKGDERIGTDINGNPVFKGADGSLDGIPYTFDERGRVKTGVAMAEPAGAGLPPTKADMIDSATKQYTALYREMAMGGRWHVYASNGSASGVAIHQDGTAPDGVTDVLVQDVHAMQARTMVNALSSELDRRNEAPPAKKKGSAPRQGARAMGVDGRATDGAPINPGDVFRTASGRETSGYPKQRGEKYASQWLIENAAAEADARGDDFNAPTFRATKPMRDGSLAPADRDSMLEYLFGNQPDVRPSILKPLVDTVRAPQPTGRDLAVPERLSVTFGGKTYQVESIADAQDKWVKFQETAGAGVSEVGNGIEVVNQDGRMVGRISYNGRAWDADGNLVAEAKGQSKAKNRPADLKMSDGDTEAIRQAKADAMKALGDIADIMGKGTRLYMMPEQEQKLLPVLTRLFDAAFRLGYLKFKEAARFALDQIRNGLGDEVANQITLEHLQGGYIGMSGRYRDQGADTVMDVAKVASLDAINDNPENEEPNDVPDPIDDLERDRANAGDAPRDVAAGGIVDGLADRTRTPGVPPVSNGGRLSGDSGVSAGQAPARRASGDQPVRAGNREDGPQEFPARGADGQRSDDPGIDRVQPDAIPASEVARAAVDGLVTADKRAAQRAAQTVKVIPGDLANARQSLPFLLPEQQEDVIKAEVKLSEPEGYGMLFTNGTGTGKTYSGLGLAKRFERQGKTNILLVVPDNKIMDDWVQSAKDLQLQVTPLRDTKDAGAGITITTYANFGDNDAVVSRSWDLVEADEAHMLMQAKDGTTTKALEKLRAITLHPRGMMERFSSLNRDDLAEQKRLSQLITDNERTINNPDTMDDHVAQLRAINAKTEIKLKALTAKLDAEREKVREFIKANQGAKRPRAAFLSATPFAWEATVDWADGYLFDYNEGYPFDETSLGYNDPTPREHFFITHFGYRKRYGKLTQPDAKVDSGLMQRQFNGWLKKRGSLSGRMLEVKADYDRRFVLVDSAIGNQIDQAIGWLEEQARAKAKEDKGDDGQVAQANGFRLLNDELRTALFGPDGYRTRLYLLEAIKAKEVIPLVRAHMELGRKVVVFHDYKKGGSINPFRFSPSDQMDPATARTQAERDDIAKHNADAEARNAAIEAFAKQFPDLAGDKLLSGLLSPIARFTREFPNVLLINGDEKPKDLLARYKTFNDDAVGPVVALVSGDKDKGWSGHDATGKHQRVLFNLGLPTKPTKTIQQEGRIYRTGQVTDAMFRYLNTGTNWERWAFATTIAERAGAAENLAGGEQARALKDAFITAYEESDAYPPGFEGEGKGGKERDRLTNNIASEFDRAVAFYWGTQKKTAKTKAQEGTDYFATPEPLGLKMTQWTNPRGGEDAMEPSAGHGAIARWFGIKLNRTAVEPSNTLGSRLALVFDGRIVSSTFEELHVSNKFDVIAMNPPFGTAGRMAIDHLAKANTHLREYGRIAALIPEGPATDAKFDKWFYGEDTRPTRPLATLTFNGRTQEVRLGDTVDAAGAKGELRDVIADGTVVRIRIGNDARLTNVNVRDIKTIAPTGKQTETYRPAEGLHMVGEVKLPGVAFERAGTNVRTRVVILEKLPEGVQPPPARRHDLSDIDDINELFARLENIDMAPRVKPAEVEVDATQAAPSQATEKAAAKAEKAQARTEGTKVAEAAGMQMVEHTTVKGKVLKGVVRKDLTQAQAKEFDAYTFKKDGGWFIRAEHVPKMIQASGQDDGPNFSMAVGSEAPFYSELARQVDAANINNASGQAWTQYLDALAKRGTIKADELEWTGLREWLQMQPAKVKREQVAEFLRANGVQVGEVTLAPEESGRDLDDWLDNWAETNYGPTAQAIQEGESWEDIRAAAREEGRTEILRRLDAKIQPAKFAKWTVPGGKNYREVLLTLPTRTGWDVFDARDGKPVANFPTEAEARADAERRGATFDFGRHGDRLDPTSYKSGHWDQPNVLAHIRVDERTDADGKRVLFVQEVQSDWGQQGKKTGFKVKDVEAERERLYAEGNIRAASTVSMDNASKTPAAPFVTKTDAWVGLAIKRVVKMAADEGFDRVAFTTGQQAADLFDLSKQVSKVEWLPQTKVLRAFDTNGSAVYDKVTEPDQIEDLIGKDVAQKLLNSEPYTSGSGKKVHRLEGVDLKVGGEGMRTFYDQIVPKVAREVLKKVGGGQLGRVELGQAGAFDKFEGIEGGRVVHTFDTRSGAARWVAMGAEDGIQREMKPVGRMPQPGFDITPEMRAKAAQGLPLFSQGARPSLASLGITPIGGAPTFKAGASGYDVAGVGGVNEGTISKADLDAIARDLSRGWRGLTGGQIVAVDSWRDLPEQIVQDALRKRFNPAGIEGVEFHGKVYLVASAITSREQAERIVFHEVLGHMGLKGALGGSPNARLNQLWDSMNGLAGVTKLAKAYEAQPGKTVWDRLQPYIRATEGKPLDVRRSTIMNELIAFLAQARDERPMTQFKGYLADLKAAVVFLLRRLGAKTLATKLDRAGTELDVLALVRDARKAIVTGKTAKGEPFQFVYGGSPNKPDPQFSINQGDDLSSAKAKAGLPAKKGLGKSVRDYLADRVALAMDIVRNRNNAASDAWLNAQQGALDQFTGIANAVRRDVGNLPAEQDPYIAARLANGGTSAVMRGLLMHGKARWAANGQHLEKVPGSKGLLQILEPLGDDLNDWFGWMVGNRAARLLAEGRENNFTAAEIKALQGLAGPAGGEKRVLFNKVAVQYADFKRSVLDVAQGAGLIDAEARKVWDHADYIPFYRQIDERASFSPTGKKGLAGQSSGIRTLKGGSAALNDPMENLLMNFSRLVDASLKNNALRKTVDTLGDGPAISKIGYDMKPAIVPRSEIEKSLEASGVPEELLALLPPELFEGMAKMWSITQPADSDVIRVMRGGKPEFYRVHDPLLLRAATSFVPYDFPGLAAARWFKRVLTQTVTATPEFMLRNFIRDTASTQMTGRDKVKLRDVAKGIADSYRETGAAEAMLFAGASFQSGNVNAADPTGTARGIRRALRRRGFDASSIDSFLGTVVDKGLLGWERYRDMTDAVENANREAVYKAAMAAGNSPTEAAYQAKDLMDFSLRGSHPLYQVLADTLPFFNARIQGLYRVGRSDPKRLARYGAIMLVASLALAAYNAGEDWYEELPDWDKDTYWHIKVGGQHFRIPKPFELGVIFSTLPERILRNLIGVDSGNKTAARVWANIRDQLAIDLVPQMIRPGLNVWANKDNFRDAPIENESDEGKLPFMRYDGRTSATMKALTSAAPGLSNALGASPKKLEYLVGGYFGTAGMWALALSDSAVRAATGAAPSPAPRADDLPVIRAFYRVDPARSTVFESDLYTMREQVEKIHKSVQALREEERDDEADAMEAEDIDKLAARELIQVTTRRLAQLNKRRNAIYADRDMTPAEKREALDEMQLERNELVREVMTSDAVKAADR